VRDALVITASFELPGVRREDIKLNVHEGNLMLFGAQHSKLIPYGTPPSNVPLSPPVGTILKQGVCPSNYNVNNRKITAD
jgi:hypothetical protein